MTRHQTKPHAQLETEPALLTRDEFRAQVFVRTGGKCVFCERAAVDAHHILERKLFVATGGYFADNGAAVCAEHHWACETTQLSVEEVRAAAGIAKPVLPPGFDGSRSYDKWGNRILSGNWSGYRIAGPLINDAGARKALAIGGVLQLLLDDTSAAQALLEEESTS